MEKHILFIVENETVPFDKRVWYEAVAMKEAGYRISIISPKGRGYTKTFEKIDGINIYRHPALIEARGKVGFVFEYLNAVFWEVLLSVPIFVRKPFTVIHGANPPDTVFLVALLYKVFGTKYIFDHHDIVPENYLAKFNRKDFMYQLVLLMEKLSFMTADLVISTNQSYREIAIRRGKKNEEQIFVVRNGPDLAKVLFVLPNKNWKEGFEYLVVYVGTIGKQECIDALLRIVKYIVSVKGLYNIKFVIVGTGTEWSDLVEQSKKMGLQKHVLFTGFVSYKEFYEIIATADVCVNPEYRNDFTDKSTMVKIMDYMLMGKPIVKFDTTEGRVTAAESAVYVEENDDVAFAEAIIELLHDPEKRQRMGELASRRILDVLNWDKQKGNLRKAYEYLETLPKLQKS